MIKKSYRKSVLGLAASITSITVSAQGITDAGFPMVDPKLDDPTKPWCYFTHPVTCIGMPWQPDRIGIQVTPEGNVYTGSAEFCLFWGEKNIPLACRQRQFLDGYIPVVFDYWSDGALRYDYEVFGALLPSDPDNKNTAIFAKLTIRNTGAQPATAKTAAAFRQCGIGHRERNAGFNPKWKYEIKDNALVRSGDTVGVYPAPSKWEAVSGTPYSQPFGGNELGVVPRTEVGIARYTKELAPGETMALVFKFPRIPTANALYLAELHAADYAEYRANVVAYWKKAVTKCSLIRTPGEPKIAESHRATAVHVMLATRTYNGKKTQTDGLPYPDLFLTAVYDYAKLYDSFGLKDFLRPNFQNFVDRQQQDGLFVDIAISHGQIIFCGHGQPMAAIADHIVNTRDLELGKKFFPSIKRGVECIMNDSKTQPHGLMRASIPYDNEMIKGQYTCHNYWSLIALWSAINMAKLLGENDSATAWLKFFDDYEKLVVKAVRESAHADGYVPTGLYKFITGPAARDGFAEYRTDQDWENEMLLWPTELVQPGDPLVVGTLKRLHDTKYREGIMTYRNGQHLHQYMTSRAANQSILNGDQKQALIDIYHAMMHSGSAYESFENMIRPWTDRDVEFCPPPHAWGCSTYNGLIRNLFVAEFGGRGGLEPRNRDLLLLNAISPAWFKKGEPLGIENAPTSFGSVSCLLTPRDGGADVVIKSEFHQKPRSLVVRIPYFVKLNSFKSDAQSATRDGEVIRLSPDATHLALEWTLNPDADKELFQNILLGYRSEPGFWPGRRDQMPKAPEGFLTDAEKARPYAALSYDLVLDAWKTEYARRFSEHAAKNGKVKTFHATEMQNPAERTGHPHGLGGGLGAGGLTTNTR